MFSGRFMKKCVDGRLHERVRFSEKKWEEELALQAEDFGCMKLLGIKITTLEASSGAIEGVQV